MARKGKENWRKRILLLGERNDDHSRRLTHALRQRGASVTRRSLRLLGIDTTRPFGLDLGGFDGLPDGVFVRGIPAGSFEQITLRLGVLHALRELGVPVWNDARAIEACIDKSMTSHLLAKARIPTPPTFTAQSLEGGMALGMREIGAGHRLVCKPLFGAQGRGLKLMEKVEDLPTLDEAGGVFYLQRFVASGKTACDFRVFVCAGSPVAGMTRIARDGAWITNVKQGGQPQTLLVNEEIGTLASRAAAVTGADYAGVDLIRSAEGELLVLEVNSMPAWTGLQSVSAGIDISATIAAAFIKAVRACDKSGLGAEAHSA